MPIDQPAAKIASLGFVPKEERPDEELSAFERA
jgi:hypothetical protein